MCLSCVCASFSLSLSATISLCLLLVCVTLLLLCVSVSISCALTMWKTAEKKSVESGSSVSGVCRVFAKDETTAKHFSFRIWHLFSYKYVWCVNRLLSRECPPFVSFDTDGFTTNQYLRYRCECNSTLPPSSPLPCCSIRHIERVRAAVTFILIQKHVKRAAAAFTIQ